MGGKWQFFSQLTLLPKYVEILYHGNWHFAKYAEILQYNMEIVGKSSANGLFFPYRWPEGDEDTRPLQPVPRFQPAGFHGHLLYERYLGNLTGFDPRLEDSDVWRCLVVKKWAIGTNGRCTKRGDSTREEDVTSWKVHFQVPDEYIIWLWINTY